GRHFYSVWRRSEYIVDFPVAEILRQLNVAEGMEPDDVNGWGGSENVGGSPRGRGSSLSPVQVEEVVKSVIATSPVRRWGRATTTQETPTVAAEPAAIEPAVAGQRRVR